MSAKLLKKFSDRCFSNLEEKERFLASFNSPAPLHPCILWCDDPPDPHPFAIEPREPWQPKRVDRLSIGEQPGKHPAHQRGAYYCLDFSSVFAASPLLTLPENVKVAIDVCAAPGGKSLLAWQLLHPQLLLSNEVVGKRLGTLVANLKRCQVSHFSPEERGAIATQLDPQRLAEYFPESADIVLVDAPCSGQSLLLKGKKVPGCFHPVTLNRNANRQKRIIGNAARLVAPGGYLLYMTCTYSVPENEGVCQWLQKHYPQFQPIEVAHLGAYQSHLGQFPCYRLWPQQGLGAGAFTALFQNRSSGQQSAISWEMLQECDRFFRE
ncbi:RsmB/NOP family class I SAM-dependent RNA methyltransferase [Roseofilum casamattae]|uniref:RsmB/NOP family class I SAM-dependent RNA methyltransferase n=1 Tax=Roseofilum casamattae BLCC-M143 TaxID=3022442 RepID=A0ABT7BZI7_9CYAN|nr:RsmB/NOP family class I SAM-dependent RNA methyltransferase [Roseofilum casamattae]MDJ1184619.1 RsmB/NOP family class I SAM-dependent RNA methyltransferase [Roseofilum casamattae BLCC-M143]